MNFSTMVTSVVRLLIARVDVFPSLLISCISRVALIILILSSLDTPEATLDARNEVTAMTANDMKVNRRRYAPIARISFRSPSLTAMLIIGFRMVMASTCAMAPRTWIATMKARVHLYGCRSLFMLLSRSLSMYLDSLPINKT